jgi:hypothetical protein
MNPDKWNHVSSESGQHYQANCYYTNYKTGFFGANQEGEVFGPL